MDGKTKQLRGQKVNDNVCVRFFILEVNFNSRSRKSYEDVSSIANVFLFEEEKNALPILNMLQI